MGGVERNDYKKIFSTYGKNFSKELFMAEKNYAARCFALAPLQKDSKMIIDLIDDPAFLVSSVAAMAAIQLDKREAVVKIIEKMTHSWGYAKYYFRDILLGPESMHIFCG